MSACVWEEIHGFQSLGEYQNSSYILRVRLRQGMPKKYFLFLFVIKVLSLAGDGSKMLILARNGG